MSVLRKPSNGSEQSKEKKSVDSRWLIKRWVVSTTVFEMTLDVTMGWKVWSVTEEKDHSSK